MAKEPAKILFLDDSKDLRELMEAFLASALGEKCRCFSNLMEFENHIEEVLRARVAIIDINLGPNVPGGIEAFQWLKDHGFQGKVLFFTGHARNNPQVALAEQSGVEILEKPLRPDKLISTVRGALRETK